MSLRCQDNFQSLDHFAAQLNNDRFQDAHCFYLTSAFSFSHFLFNLQAEEEVSLRAKEALCTCTVKTSMEEMGLLELRYITGI